MKNEIIYLEGIKRYLASEEGMEKVMSYLTRTEKLAVKQVIRRGDDELVIAAKIIFPNEKIDKDIISNTINDILLMY